MRMTQLFSGEFYNIVLEFCIQKSLPLSYENKLIFRFSNQEEIPCLNEGFTLPFFCSSIYLNPPPPHLVKSPVIGWHSVLLRFHPRVQRSNINARKQRPVSSLPSNCLRKSLKMAGNVSRDNLRIFRRLLPKFDNNT